MLTGVDVLAPRPVNALVAVGDSITDGVGSGIDADERWSDALADAPRPPRRRDDDGGAERRDLRATELLAGRRPAAAATSPLARFDRDVAAAPGATDVVLHIGTNDIAAGRSAAEIVGGLVRASPSVARAAGKRVFLTTITPVRAPAPHGTPGPPSRRAGS